MTNLGCGGTVLPTRSPKRQDMDIDISESSHGGVFIRRDDQVITLQWSIDVRRHYIVEQEGALVGPSKLDEDNQ